MVRFNIFGCRAPTGNPEVVLGPFDWVQLTYEALIVSTFEQQTLAYQGDTWGPWIFQDWALEKYPELRRLEVEGAFFATDIAIYSA